MAVSLLDNAASVDALDTRTITIGNSSKNITGNTTYTLAEIGLLGTGDTATSTVRLANSRTINGTSFDGGSNIVTYSWGPSRTITIGNKSVAVNGASNYTWSLGDIGIASRGLAKITIYGGSWTNNSGSGSDRYEFTIPAGLSLGDFRVCVITSNGSNNRYYQEFVPWSDMFATNSYGGGRHRLLTSVGPSSTSYFIYLDQLTRKVSFLAAASNNRIIKLWLELIAGEN